MSGLLDFLSTDEGRMGLGLLAAAGPRSDGMGVGGRIQLAMQGMDARKQEALKSKLLEMQMKNYESEIDSRKLAGVKDARQQANLDRFMNGDDNAGAVSPGAFSPSRDGNGPVMPMNAPQATQGGIQGGAIAYARSIGIPDKAIQADMAFNGGKGIADMMFKRGTPNMKVVDGYAYDENNLKPGFLPGITTSNSGQSSLRMPGSDGLPVISAPRGSLETYGAYKDTDAGKRPMKVFNPATGREEYVTEKDVIDAARPPPPARLPLLNPPVAPISSTPGQTRSPLAPRQGDSDQRAVFEQEYKAAQGRMAAAGTAEEKVRAAFDLKSLEREMGRIKMPTPISSPTSGNFAAGPSAAETTATKAADAFAVGTANANVVRDTEKTKKVSAANQMISASNRAIELLKEGPTASGIGESADKVANFFGATTKGAQISSKLDIVSGDLVNNVPRMEGPQSDGDRAEYKMQAGRVADRSLPTEQRIAAAQEVQKLQNKYLSLNGGAANTGGATGSFDDKPASKPQGQSFDAKPPAQQHKGKTITNPDGSRETSDGFIWMAVK